MNASQSSSPRAAWDRLTAAFTVGLLTGVLAQSIGYKYIKTWPAVGMRKNPDQLATDYRHQLDARRKELAREKESLQKNISLLDELNRRKTNRETARRLQTEIEDGKKRINKLEEIVAMLNTEFGELGVVIRESGNVPVFNDDNRVLQKRLMMEHEAGLDGR